MHKYTNRVEDDSEVLMISKRDTLIKFMMCVHLLDLICVCMNGYVL